MANSIFVLGAGFSAAAKMPVQADLMREILKRASKERIRTAISSLFNVFQVADMAQVPLEDIFTMLDRARRARETIPGFSEQQLEESHRLLISSIAEEFKRRLSSFPRPCYDAFFSQLIERRVGDGSAEAREVAPFSIFTLNWDTIPDYLIRVLGRSKGVDVNYACNDHALTDDNEHIPGSLRRPFGDFTINLFKLHGSLNWLICSSCGRLFSSISEASPPVLCGDPYRCRFCGKVDLQSVLIMPTFFKDLGSIHIGLLWHGALLALQDADRLVFVGYSLPMADFEFRYLLLRGIASRHDIAIRVVLYPDDDHLSDARQRFERFEVEQRYRRFFGSRDVEFKYMDAATFMMDPSLIWHW